MYIIYIGKCINTSMRKHVRYIHTHTLKGYFNRVVAEFMVIKPVKRDLRFLIFYSHNTHIKYIFIVTVHREITLIRRYLH